MDILITISMFMAGVGLGFGNCELNIGDKKIKGVGYIISAIGFGILALLKVKL